MADGIVQVPVDSTGKKIDTSEITVSGNVVERQRIVVADAVNPTSLQVITSDGAAAVAAIVSDTPNSFIDNQVQPLSLTREGRLRVSATVADIDQVWNYTFESPWSSFNAWDMENLNYV